MKNTINQYEFVRKFDDYNRSDSFSVSGRYALFEYLTQFEEDCGIEIELDVIGLCCDYSEYESLLAFGNEYFADEAQRNDDCGIDDDMDEDEIEDAIREYIEDHGQLIEFDGGIIVSSF